MNWQYLLTLPQYNKCMWICFRASNVYIWLYKQTTLLSLQRFTVVFKTGQYEDVIIFFCKIIVAIFALHILFKSDSQFLQMYLETVIAKAVNLFVELSKLNSESFPGTSWYMFSLQTSATVFCSFQYVIFYIFC